MASQPFHWHYAECEDANYQLPGTTLFFIIVLLSLILLVAILILYSRWICRSSQAPPQQLVQLSHHHGLDPTCINKLPITFYGTNTSCNIFGDQAECCICLGVFQDGDKVKILPVTNTQDGVSFSHSISNKPQISQTSGTFRNQNMKPSSVIISAAATTLLLLFQEYRTKI
ncbi:RING-H2 finger protein ATL66-like [Lycium barbarum]|uniref:RING-H2 finger protein ATL66-like n=1 Tax=Lycium barbarum TaxID=112863 RepID=UPI00293E5A7E|nr:RING-H2 finger protein ATL66-like [Lycium barbarum]